MLNLLETKINQSFKLTKDLYSSLDESRLGLKIPEVPSNTFASQVWCMVGARESYLKAIEQSAWQGFSSSLQKDSAKEVILQALDDSEKQFARYKVKDFNDVQYEYAFDLLEHEIQHHGQLIRMVYANELQFPASWSERYTV